MLFWKPSQPFLVLINWNNCVRFHFIICPPLWNIIITNSRQLWHSLPCRKWIRLFASYKKKLRQVLTNHAAAISHITTLRYPPLPFCRAFCPHIRVGRREHTPRLFPLIWCISWKLNEFQFVRICKAELQDEVQAQRPFGKLLPRSGDFQGEKADTCDKSEYFKTAVAFFFMTKSKTIVPQHSLKLHWH